MSDRLRELRIFVRVCESGSFSRAGRELGLSQPSVSRIIDELEMRLGVKLVLRTTRSVTVTDAGEIFLDRTRAILAELEDAEDAARGVDSLRGVLRIAMPVVYGTREIVPHLSAFLARHPQLRIEISASDEWQNLVHEGVDLAIRIGKLTDSAFGARKLIVMRRYLVASPRYLKARGIPKIPADLAAHDCIFGPGLASRQSWSFRRGSAVTSVDVSGRLQTDSSSTMFAAVMAGLGVTIGSDAMCGAELMSGELVALLPDYKLDDVDVHAVFPAGPKPSQKVRAFVDYLTESLKESVRQPPGRLQSMDALRRRRKQNAVAR